MNAIKEKSDIATHGRNANFWIAVTGTLLFFDCVQFIMNLPNNMPINKELTDSIKKL
jgi:hypothetical protein